MINRLQIVRRYGDTDFVTALRALAATLVVVIHAGAFIDFGDVGQNIVRSGKYGVQMFFVISGFSIATTFASATSYREFFVRRLFRIIPLYWLMILVAGALTINGLLPRNHWANYFEANLNLYNFFMHFCFLSCLDHTVGTTILGVEWTIPVEMFWYAALPAIIVFAKSRQRLILAIALSVAGIGVTQLLAKMFVSPDPSLFSKWFPTSHGPYFLMGVLGYQIRQSSGTWLHQNATAVLLTAWIATIISVIAGTSGQGIVFAVATLLTIGLFHADRHPTVAAVVTARPFIFVGSISYSLYLVHFPIILFLQEFADLNEGWTLFAVSYSVSLIISTFTYLTIEYPMNQTGKRFSGRRPDLLSMPQRDSHVPAAPPTREAA